MTFAVHVSRNIPRYTVYTLVLGKYKTSIHKDVQDMWEQCWNSRFTESTKCGILDECWWKVKPVLLFHCNFWGTSRKRINQTLYMMNTVHGWNYQIGKADCQIRRQKLREKLEVRLDRVVGPNKMTWQDENQEPLRLLVATIFWVDWIRLIMVKRGPSNFKVVI